MTDTKRSPENLKRLTEIHKQRYSSRLQAGEAGNPMVRVDECRHLLSLWEGVEKKGYDFDKLTKAERYEVLDAIYDEQSEDDEAIRRPNTGS